MRIKTILYTIFILAVSCTNNTQQLESGVIQVPINLTSPEKEMPLSTFIDSTTTIRLTLPDSLFFGTVSRIYFTDSDIFAIDSKQGCVFRFNHAGEYINTIGQRGGGPGEYVNLSSCFLGDSCLFIDDLFTRKIFSYKYDGSFLKNISFPFHLIYDDIISLSDSTFLCYQLFCPTESEERGVWIMNDKGEKIKTLLSEKEIYPYYSSMFSRIYSTKNGKIHFFNPSKGDFYSYDKQKQQIVKTYHLHPDIKTISEYMGYKNGLDVKEKNACCEMAIQSDNYLYTFWVIYSDSPIGKTVHALYDLHTHEIKSFVNPLIDFPDMFSLGLYVSSNYPNAIIVQYPDEYFAEYYPQKYKELAMKENILLIKILHFK